MGFKIICNECGEVEFLIEKFKNKDAVEKIELYEDYEGSLMIKCKNCGNIVEVYV